MNKTGFTSEQVADLAIKYLAKYQPSNYQILIDRSGVREGADGWWEVPIKPSDATAPIFDWTGRSAEAAVDIDEAEGVHILFM